MPGWDRGSPRGPSHQDPHVCELELISQKRFYQDTIMREMVHKHSTLHTLAFAFAAISLGMLLFHHPVEAKEKKVEFAIATFAGGCFWCLEPPFHDLNGVVDVVAGYSGGGKRGMWNPSR